MSASVPAAGPIASLIAALSGYPSLKLARLGDRLEIENPAPGSFPVSLRETGGRFTVALGPCRWSFTDSREAVDHVLFGLSDRCRLREISRGAPYRWIVEQISDRGWMPLNERRTLAVRFWKPRSERLLRNSVVTW